MEITLGKITLHNHPLFLKEEKLSGYLKGIYASYR